MIPEFINVFFSGSFFIGLKSYKQFGPEIIMEKNTKDYDETGRLIEWKCERRNKNVVDYKMVV